MKKHLLFLSYYFPPQRNIAAVRTGAMARALVDAGWKVTVITIANVLLVNVDGQRLNSDVALRDAITVIGTGHSWRILVPGIVHTAPNKGLHWLLGGIGRRVVRVLSLDRAIGWRKHALAASSAFKPGDVDVVLSSGGPWVSHQVAAQISSRLNCPYVLDYRDLWSGNPHTPVKWRCITNSERSLYHGAAAIITITPSMQSVQRELLGHHPNTIIISNGYNRHEYENITPAAFQDFALVYAGRFVPPVGIVDPLLMVIRQLKDCQTAIPWSFHYYGPNTTYVEKAAVRHGVQEKVYIHGLRSRREALSAVKGAGVVLVVASVAKIANAAEASILTGKVFESIGLGAPFLVVAPQNADIRNVVEITGGGGVFSADEVDAMTQYICRLMEGRRIPYRLSQDYSWGHLGNRVSDFLRGIVEGTASHR